MDTMLLKCEIGIPNNKQFSAGISIRFWFRTVIRNGHYKFNMQWVFEYKQNK